MELLQRAFAEAGANGVALETVLAELGQELFHYARVLTGSPETAEDAVQDLLVTLLRQGAALRTVRDPRAWLFTVLRRKALGYRKSPAPLAEKMVAAVEADLEEQLLLVEALQALGETEQEVVLLHLWEGLTFEEISTVLNQPRGTVLSRYHRTIQHLRRKLGYSPARLNRGTQEP